MVKALIDQPREAGVLAALTASLAGHRQEAGVPPRSLAMERARPSPPVPLAGMEGLLAAVQASSSGDLDIPPTAPAMQGTIALPLRALPASVCP